MINLEDLIRVDWREGRPPFHCVEWESV